MISITKFACREKKQSEDENLTLQEEIRLRRRKLVFAKKKETKPSEDKGLTSLGILESEKRWSENQLSLRDEDIKKVEDQKLKNESLDKEKDHFALVVEKDCHYLS